jgi:DNA-binding transcriptional MerR regulator
MGKPDERLPRTLTITAFGRRHGLSRSALLYYDRNGLLSPSARSPAGYRLYTESDGERLCRIRALRATGLPLARIAQALADEATLAGALGAQVAALEAQARALRDRQQVLARMLLQPDAFVPGARLTKDSWTAMFRAIGMDDAAMWRWHSEFEHSLPDAHRAFLASLGLPAPEIARIRHRAAADKKTPRPP